MNYSEAEFDKAYKKIIRRIIKSKSPVNNPMAYILGGQPGAGKTGLQRNLMVENSNIIIINADAYRNSHPRFNEIQAEFGTLAQRHTQPFINEVVEKLISDLSDMKYSLVIEGTLRTAEIPLNTCRMLKNKGYSVELHIISVKKKFHTKALYTDMKIIWNLEWFHVQQRKKIMIMLLMLFVIILI